MLLACLDLEGVLLPEIWINVADKTGIKELRLTTRDINDYDKLMKYRLEILRKNNIKMKDITDVIETLSPLPGAIGFLEKLRAKYQVIILSDTFYQFAMPLMKKLANPTLFCHDLVIDKDGFVGNYILRMKDSKKNAVIELHKLNFKIIASGDSYNDVTMLSEADRGIFFCPPDNVIKEFPQFPVTTGYDSLLNEFEKAEKEIFKN
jgi:phosphoserine / homoserine phosphotransferase